jgi:O-antigen/teichoic acid export membrane protein
LKSTSQILVVQVIGGIFSILTNLFLAWALGPAGKGANALLVVVPGLVVIATNLGLQVSMVYLVAKEKYPLADVMSTTLTMTCLISLVLTALGALVFPLLMQFVFLDIPPVLVAISLTTLPSYLLAFFLGDIFWGLKRPLAYMIIRLLPVTVYFAGGILLVGPGQMGVQGATIAFALGIHSSGVAALILAAKAAPLRLRLNKALLGEASRYGLQAYLGNLAQQSAYRIDLPMVNYFAGLGSAGNYSIAVTLAEILWYIPRSVGYVILVQTAGSDREDADRTTPLMIRGALFVSVLAAIPFALLSNTLVLLLLPSYKDALPLLWLLLPGILVANIFQVIGNDLMGRGKPMLPTWIALVGLGWSVILYFALIPPFGARGAAIASTLVYSLEAGIAVIILSRSAKLSIRRLLIPDHQDLLVYRTLRSRMRQALGQR